MPEYGKIKEKLSSPERKNEGLKDFKVDIARSYLSKLKDVKDYDEVMAKDSSKTVIAIQVLLDSFGYDVGKIDGILVSAGESTSKTMDAIRRFQQDRKITPVDGLPGPITIRELCDYSNGL